jgi:archaellum component FlaC
LNTATYIEPQCKPFHISSMSYLFQVHGLFDDFDEIHLDYSGTEHVGRAENGTHSDAALSPAADYQPAWFAPFPSPLATLLGVSSATRYCNGKDAGVAAGSMARVHAASASAEIDWNGDLDTTNTSILDQDVNFDGTVTSPPLALNGFNDWANIRLDQVGADAAGLLPGSAEDLIGELGDLAAELAELATELGGTLPTQSAELSGLAQEVHGLSQEYQGLSQEFQGLSQEFQGLGQEYQGLSQEFQGLSQEYQGLSQEYQGLSQEFQGLSQEFQGDELTFSVANELGKSRPHALTTCIIGNPGCTPASPFTALYHRVELHFTAPPFGGFTAYEVQRKRDSAPDTSFATIGTTSTNVFIDQTELASGIDYVYRVRGLATDGNSEWSSSSAPVTGVNDAPVAVGNGTFNVWNKATLPLTIQTDLLFDDQDGDSPTAFLARRLVVVTVQPTHGTLTLNNNGTILTYTPDKNYVGPDSFNYQADDGLTSDSPQVPLSGLSNEVTVTINVTQTK